MPFPAPNTQPIFIRRPNFWSVNLTNETVPGLLVGSATPKLLGRSGEAGSLIEEMFVQATGNHPLTTVFFYLKNDEGLDYVACAAKTLVENTTYNVNNYNINANGEDPQGIPLWKLLSPASCNGDAPHSGLRLPPNTSLYAGLTVAVTNPITVIAMGGDY